ncbi:hypothetical protein Tco_1410119 [Tanacetum coccineum]
MNMGQGQTDAEWLEQWWNLFRQYGWAVCGSKRYNAVQNVGIQVILLGMYNLTKEKGCGLSSDSVVSIAQKEDALGIQLQVNEFDLMATAAARY